MKDIWAAHQFSIRNFGQGIGAGVSSPVIFIFLPFSRRRISSVFSEFTLTPVICSESLYLFSASLSDDFGGITYQQWILTLLVHFLTNIISLLSYCVFWRMFLLSLINSKEFKDLFSRTFSTIVDWSDYFKVIILFICWYQYIAPLLSPCFEKVPTYLLKLQVRTDSIKLSANMSWVNIHLWNRVKYSTTTNHAHPILKLYKSYWCLWFWEAAYHHSEDMNETIRFYDKYLLLTYLLTDLYSVASNQRLQCVILHIWQKALIFIPYRSHLYDVQVKLICCFKNTHMITSIHQWTRINRRILKAYPITKVYERLDEIRSHLLLKECSWMFLLLKKYEKEYRVRKKLCQMS